MNKANEILYEKELDRSLWVHQDHIGSFAKCLKPSCIRNNHALELMRGDYEQIQKLIVIGSPLENISEAYGITVRQVKLLGQL